MTDEFLLDTPLVREFFADVQAQIAAAASPLEACRSIRPRFAALLADPEWLPAPYLAPNPESGMGGGIGQWLLCRAGDGSLSLFSLVVPPEAATPVHDHLAWGLVGLYRGAQDEEIFVHESSVLRLGRAAHARARDFYELLPPRDDIHRVRTTSRERLRRSIHLLTQRHGMRLAPYVRPRVGSRAPLPLRLRQRVVPTLALTPGAPVDLWATRVVYKQPFWLSEP